jgi:3',5'-cyclic-AMP phosphodiesterase
MPVHLPSLSRRRFVAALGGALAALPLRHLHAAEADEDLVAIFNDTHIGEKQGENTKVPLNLKAAIDHLLGLPRRPAAVVINGDLALKDGQPGDYALFARLLEPLRAAGLPVHLTLGNHDERDVFYGVLKNEQPRRPVVVAKHVGVVPLRRANLFLLDSLKATMITQGLVGAEQLTWLGRQLDKHTDRPAIVFSHHNPRLGGDPNHFPGGLEDSEPLWKLFAAHRQVKAYVHGHIHHWGLARHEGVHIVNTPATSYVGNPQLSTTGWTLAKLQPGGMTVTTFTHDPAHPWHQAQHTLGWRA